MLEEKIFAGLRSCFAAGYTMPQFCIDKKIKKPLFVLEKNFELFFKEIYAQFKYDGRLTANFCFIDVNKNTKFSLDQRVLGVNIVVESFSSMQLDYYDKIIFLTDKTPETSNDKIISFDELEKFFIGRTYVDIPLLNFLQRHPGVKLLLTNNFPNIGRYSGGIEFRSKLLSAKELYRTLIASKNDTVETTFDRFGYNNAQVIQLLKMDKAKKNLDGTTSLFNDMHPLRQIINGKRRTAYQPDKYLNRIYFLGPCHYFGRNAPFDKTIESYLQQMLNENNLPYCVENEGQAFSERTQDMYYNLNALNLKAGDIIFFYIWDMYPNDNIVPLIDLSDVFDPPYDYREIFCTKGHVNELGYKILAEKFFNFLTENNFFRDVDFNYPPPPAPYFHRYGIPPQFETGGSKVFVNEELEAYKQTLRAKKLPIGALVMNCNPFTLGHQYLVEYAAAQVVKLYIFVVEEDKSDFPFADRLELVKQGVRHFRNVEVLPSGKFIISQQTFSGYFSKEEFQDVAVDSSEDVEIFGREIAPTLGITIRFAGEEPTDNVTRQYNETMKEILPRYGVEFREIPRKTFGDEVISASTVRAALKNGDFEKIRNLVPRSTLRYLRRQFRNSASN